MTSRNLKSAIWLTLAASAVALAAGGPPDGKGNKPSTEVGNNLSVPAIMAGGLGTFPLTCGSGSFSLLVEPDKAPVHFDEACAETHDGTVCVDEGYYYVQRDAKWQAPCASVTGPGVSVLGRWGDNLAGDAMLKVGSPIRVELVLWDGANFAVGQEGYFVIKLEPAELDRLSQYGHLAGGVEGGFYDTPYTVGDLLPDGSTFGAIVYDPTAHLRIERLVNETPVTPAVYDGAAGGEINATGKIVYGHNLRVAEAGWYRITYSFGNVSFASSASCDAGVCGGNTAYLDIEVVMGGGGGGGKGGGQGGGKPVKPGK